MWTWQPTTIAPDGGGICGGDVFETSAYSASRSSSTVVPAIWLQDAPKSIARSSSTIDISGYGIRSGSSISRTSSTLDIGRGLTIINEGGVISTDTTVIRVLGTTIYSDSSINRISDATISSEHRLTVDGGDVYQFPEDVIDGGDAVNTNRNLDGGNVT